MNHPIVMNQAEIDKIILDDKKLKKYLIDQIKEVDRPLFYKRCIQIRHQQSLSANPPIKPLDIGAYSTFCQSLFGADEPSHNLPCIPDFGSPVRFPHNDHIQPVNSLQQSQQSLLCLIKEAHHELTYCPYLTDLIAFFTRYFDDATIFALIRLMIAKRPNKPSESFYFTLNGQSFGSFIIKFYLLMKNQSRQTKDIKHHLKHMGVDITIIFQSWARRIYSGYHPESIVIRFLDGFVAFGLPWLWTWALALLELHSKAILTCPNPNIMSKLFFDDMDHSDADEIMDRACSMIGKVAKMGEKLSARDIDRYELSQDSSFLPGESLNHVPRLSGKQTSEILSNDHFCAIWCWIEPTLKVTNPQLLYATSVHGYSLATMLDRCTTGDPSVPHQPTFTVVKSTTGAIFGVYLSNSWVKESDAAQLRQASHYARYTMNEREAKVEEERLQGQIAYHDGRAFVFMLDPEARCFRHREARTEQNHKQLQVESAEKEARVLQAGREGIRQRNSKTRDSSARKHVVDNPLSEQSYSEEVSRNDQPAQHLGVESDVLRSAPLSPMAGQRGSLAHLMQMMKVKSGATLDNEAVMLCSVDEIAIGDVRGVAFSLDRHLKAGATQVTSVFDNLPLAPGLPNDGKFGCLAVEVWGFGLPI